jgi:tetratricopeptide (TPR) repeat protein
MFMNRRSHTIRAFACALALALPLVSLTAHAEKPSARGAKTPAAAEKAPESVEATPAPEAAPAVDAEAQAQAEKLKADGDALFRDRNYVDAVTAYDASYGLVADPRVLYNKGRALEALGRHALALETLTLFDKTAPEDLKSRVDGLQALMSSLRQRVCELTLLVSVEGAEVRLGNEVLGTSPLSGPLLVSAGKAELTVEKEGYFKSTQTLSLPGAGVARIDVALQSKATKAKLTIKSGVKGAAVKVDGKPLGQAPTEVVLLPGVHNVLAQHDGYNDAAMQVVLVAGQDRVVSLEPEEQEKAFYQKWWFWGGLGVVAAGTATTLILVNRQPEQTDGDFSPSTISAPLVRY